MVEEKDKSIVNVEELQAQLIYFVLQLKRPVKNLIIILRSKRKLSQLGMVPGYVSID